jgi:hypothetical protein
MGGASGGAKAKKKTNKIIAIPGRAMREHRERKGSRVHGKLELL